MKIKQVTIEPSTIIERHDTPDCLKSKVAMHVIKITDNTAGTQFYCKDEKSADALIKMLTLTM